MPRIVLVLATFIAGTSFGLIAQNARLRHMNPPALSTPTGYTHVVVPAKDAGLVFIAGQVAADKSGAVVGKGDFRAQAKQVFENLKGAVEAAGGTMDDIAKINVYATDLSQLAALREVRQQYFKANPPASTLIQVVALARPEYLLEIEAIAVVQ